VVGVVTLVVGVLGAVALWLLAAKRYDDAVAELAPAPIGCDTTLVFDRAGRYTFFVETKGSVGEIDGNCDADDRTYDLGDEDPPEVGLRLLDQDGQEVDLDRADGPSYDRSGARGSGVGTVDIEDTGDYVLTAEADDASAMIRVGRDPSSGVTAMRVGAVAVLIAGVVLGVLALVLGRRRPPTPAPAAPGPAPSWPHPGYRAPPTAPPYANPPVPPPYVVPARPPGQPPLGGPGSGQPLPPPRPPG
jgi:hypothetical protein